MNVHCHDRVSRLHVTCRGRKLRLQLTRQTNKQPQKVESQYWWFSFPAASHQQTGKARVLRTHRRGACHSCPVAVCFACQDSRPRKERPLRHKPLVSRCRLSNFPGAPLPADKNSLGTARLKGKVLQVLCGSLLWAGQAFH